MKNQFLLFSLVIVLVISSFSLDPGTKDFDLNEIEGTWQIDLRPSPDAAPYLKDFVIKLEQDNAFSGEYYETPFNNGKFNQNWDRLYFAFSTSDQNSSYFHSGYFQDGKVNGITYSPERDFVMPWSGQKTE